MFTSNNCESRRSSSRGRPAGITLLEVILSIAILGGSLAVLGELARVGTRASRAATTVATAQLLADSLMAEVCSSSTTPTPMQGVIDQYGGTDWEYSLDVQPIDDQGLLALLVTVTEQSDTRQQPVYFTLSRWMIDPQLVADLEAAEQDMLDQAAGDGSSDQDAGGDGGQRDSDSSGGGSSSGSSSSGGSAPPSGGGSGAPGSGGSLPGGLPSGLPGGLPSGFPGNLPGKLPTGGRG